MQPVIEQIKNRLPITDVLSSYITLIPSGTQYKAKCPFHNERTASFSVSPERGVYYCFGCGAKGDIFSFVESFEGVDFKGALKILAERAGVQLKRTDYTSDDTDQLYSILEETTKKYEAQLKNNAAAREYLKKRGVTEETIASFRIGYAPEEWRFIASSIAQKELSIAEKAGLIKKTDKGYYDRFRGRIMFPLFDSSGRVVGFSGRSFPDTDTGPKYLNSPETAVFQKSKVLFGFDKAKFVIKKHNFAILVEGQMDVVLSHQAGFKNTIATSGTAVSETSIEDKTANLSVLARLTPHLFLAFDGDSAGQKALRRAALVALKLTMNPKVVALPEGIDPAEYILQHGAEPWKELLKESTHFILHELSILGKEKLSPHVLVRTLKDRIFPYLAAIPSPIERNLYIETIARELSIPSIEVARELAIYIEGQPVKASPEEIIERKEQLSLVERFIALRHRYESEEIKKGYEKLEQLSFNGEQFKFPDITSDRKDAIILIVEREYGALDNSTRDSLVRELAEKIEHSFYVQLNDHYAQALKDAERRGDEDRIAALLATINELNKRRHRT
jgi:DNA primase